MIYDAIVEVSCDKCGSRIEIKPEYVYNDYSGNNGYYDTKDSSIEHQLKKDEWIVKDGRQFCSEECAA